MTILLSTLNARYTHTSLGLRYLLANMGKLQAATFLHEFIIDTPTNVIAEKILDYKPDIVGLGIYIWNVEETTKVVSMLKSLNPKIIIVLGGPEVSYETENQDICALADYIITGWGEATFPELCHHILNDNKPLSKILPGTKLDLNRIVMPYHLYNDEDIAHRTLYVEASRGCPFRCEFCLSSLDKTAQAFDTDTFLQEIELLFARGARQLKFVDRTFNLNINSSLKILDYFLDKQTKSPDDPIFVHFEVVPDHLPATLKDAIQQFLPGTLQLEIGIQTFNPEIQKNIGRKQDNEKTIVNTQWLAKHTHAHLHTDLIVGLPGEDLTSFAQSFDQLIRLKPHEIQVGILKRLKGTPILRHEKTHKIVFDAYPPYPVLKTDCIDFSSMQHMARFARYWDLIGNSGRFVHTLELILGVSPFDRFMALTDYIYETTEATHNIALDRLTRLICEWLLLDGMDKQLLKSTITRDYAGRFFDPSPKAKQPGHPKKTVSPIRQVRHLSSN